MRIAIDTREALSAHLTGKGVWARCVLRELRKHSDVTLSLYSDLRTHRSQLTAHSSFWHWKTAWRVWREKPDVYFSPTSYIVPWLLGKNIPTAVVIHDLIAFDGEPHDKKATAIERATLPRVLKTARWTFCVSEATKRDLITRFPMTDPGKITVICAGPTITKTCAKPADLQTCRPADPYILSIGTLCPRKNQLRLIHAFNSLPDAIKKTHRLILAGGRGWNDQDIIDLASASHNVEWLGYVPENELTELLKNATLLAYPSIKEGFGFPVLDAMTLGIPVLTSKGTSMEEIAVGAAELVDPESTQSITDGIHCMITNASHCQTLAISGMKRATEFSWRKTTDVILGAIASSIGHHSPSPSPYPLPLRRERVL